MTPRQFVANLKAALPEHEFDNLCLMAAAGEMGSNQKRPDYFYAPDGAG